ncbi:MAG: elongation factor P [Gammaproteobacteria bacterium]
MPIISATEVRGGALIAVKGRLWRVVSARHVHVGGRGGAYMQVEAKDLETGAKNGMRLRTDEKIERPFVEQRKMRYLYPEGGERVLMDEENYEQLTLPDAFFDDGARFLAPDAVIVVHFYQEKAISADLPPSVALAVTETDPQHKGATAAAAYKPATLETGAVVMVPPFIGSGETIRINTATGEYIERG